MGNSSCYQHPAGMPAAYNEGFLGRGSNLGPAAELANMELADALTIIPPSCCGSLYLVTLTFHILLLPQETTVNNLSILGAGIA